MWRRGGGWAKQEENERGIEIFSPAPPAATCIFKLARSFVLSRTRATPVTFSPMEQIFTWASKVMRICIGFHLYPIGIGLETVPISQPIRRNSKSCYGSLTHVFPRLAPDNCVFFGFWLVHWIACVRSDWPERTECEWTCVRTGERKMYVGTSF